MAICYKLVFELLLASAFACLLVRGHRLPRIIQAQPRIGYSSSVVHPYPNDDLNAESSIKANFQPQQSVSSHLGRYKGVSKYAHSAPNSVITRTVPDSFNVGYNISFSPNNNRPRKNEQRYTKFNNKKFENAEVITGKLKKNEQVRAPPDLSPEDFVAHAFLKQKQINSDRPRYTSTRNNNYKPTIRQHASKYPSQSAILNFNTQQTIFKDVIRATKPDSGSYLHQDVKASYQAGEVWKNASPGLEISKSVEHPNAGYGRYTSQNFNHNSALQNSESFDFRNAHGDIIFPDKDKTSDNFPEGSEQYAQAIPFQSKTDLQNLDINAHIPAKLRGVKPLPLDTSLLKDPVLTTDYNKQIPKDSKVIPIRFDLRQIQSAVQNFGSNPNFNSQGYGTNAYGSQQETVQTSKTSSLANNEENQASSSQKNYRIYGNAQPVDQNKYSDLSYKGKRQLARDGIYSMVSMRPPSVNHNFRY